MPSPSVIELSAILSICWASFLLSSYLVWGKIHCGKILQNCTCTLHASHSQTWQCYSFQFWVCDPRRSWAFATHLITGPCYKICQQENCTNLASSEEKCPAITKRALKMPEIRARLSHRVCQLCASRKVMALMQRQMGSMHHIKAGRAVIPSSCETILGTRPCYKLNLTQGEFQLLFCFR